MPYYDDIYLAEDDELVPNLMDMEIGELEVRVDRLERDLGDESAGGPPGWRVQAEAALRVMTQRLNWLLDQEATTVPDEDDGK
jgi:hypothetical protein